MSEFYGPTGAPDLGDPALDPPMTVRIERWEDRLRPDVKRAVRSSRGEPLCWLLVAGPSPAADWLIGEWLTNGDVRTWPVCPAVVNEAAYHLATNRAPREGLVQSAERGDLDVDSFKGGKP